MGAGLEKLLPTYFYDDERFYLLVVWHYGIVCP